MSEKIQRVISILFLGVIIWGLISSYRFESNIKQKWISEDEIVRVDKLTFIDGVNNSSIIVGQALKEFGIQIWTIVKYSWPTGSLEIGDLTEKEMQKDNANDIYQKNVKRANERRERLKLNQENLIIFFNYKKDGVISFFIKIFIYIINLLVNFIIEIFITIFVMFKFLYDILFIKGLKLEYYIGVIVTSLFWSLLFYLMQRYSNDGNETENNENVESVKV